MSQLISVSSPSSGREMLERAAMRRRSFFPDRFARHYARPIPVCIVYTAPIEIPRPAQPAPLPVALSDPVSEMALEAAAIAALVGKRTRVIDVICATAEHFDVRRIDLLAHRRTHDITVPRQVAMFLSRELTPRSLPEIGRLLGGKDHTTILHGCRNVEKWIAAGSSILADVEAIRARLLA
jgi:hypothetical protein